MFSDTSTESLFLSFLTHRPHNFHLFPTLASAQSRRRNASLPISAESVYYPTGSNNPSFLRASRFTAVRALLVSSYRKPPQPYRPPLGTGLYYRHYVVLRLYHVYACVVHDACERIIVRGRYYIDHAPIL